MQPLSVVILAAGQGKRMFSDLPKVLQPLAGRPLLAHVLEAARTLEPEQICVVYGHGGQEVQAAFPHEAIDWVLQAEQLGTGHAVMQAMTVIPDDHVVLVLYGDVPLIGTTSLEQLVSAADAGAIAVLSVRVECPTGYGRILRDPDGQLRSIVEERDARPDELEIREVNSGLMAAPAARLRELLLGLGRDNVQREYYLTDIVASAVLAGDPAVALPAASVTEVLGVNDRLQLAQVEACYRRRSAEALLRAGATLADPARIDVRGTVEVERDVFIDVGVVLIGKVHLGARVRIGPYCILRDVTVGADTVVQPHCVLEEATVGERCRIGPFARLRPESVLRQDVHIGNFVEVKKSVVGARSKANHLTYLGDAHVGNDVNVGAGTITCNYDGANKWPTSIGDGAFIGSGSMLVAPLRIGAGATIGAGSTIVAPAPDGKLTLSRAAQVTVEAWERPAKLGADEHTQKVEAALGPSPKGSA